MADDVQKSWYSRHYETTRRPRPQTDKVHAEDDYFERASLIYYILVIFGLVTFEILCFQTESYPFELLGGPGQRLLYLAENHLPMLQFGFIVSIVVHIIEAVYAFFQCKSINLSAAATNKWTLQTLTLGYFSLRLLNAYCERKNKRR